MPSVEAEKNRKHVLRRECKLRVELLVRCQSKNTGEISENWVTAKASLLDLNRNTAHLLSRNPIEENQELRIAIGFPTGVIVKATGLVYSSKFLPKLEVYGVEVRFMSMNEMDRTRLDFFLTSLEQE